MPTSPLPLTHHLATLQASARTRRILALLIAAGFAVGVAWPKLSEWHATSSRVTELTQTIAQTQKKLAAARTDYRTIKSAYATQAIADKDKIERVLPGSPQETDIARLIEKTINDLAATDPAIGLKTVKFSDIQKQNDTDYLTVPFKISVSTNRANLDKFLQFLERSGNPAGTNETTTRFFIVKNLDISINPNFDPRIAKGDIEAELSVDAYALTPEAQQKMSIAIEPTTSATDAAATPAQPTAKQ